MLSTKILNFYKNLQHIHLPDGFDIILPFGNGDTWKATEAFYNKYYNDTNERIFMLGINPGRFGGGVTGIPFTDPIRLEKECGITNPFPKKPEVSSEFIYAMINAYGGPEKFYGRYYINSLFPLTLTHKGKNINYYDTKELLEITRQPIIDNIRTQIAFGLRTDKAICLGEGKNYQYLLKLNAEYNFFGEIHPLPHPRFIMQYKRKLVQEYIGRYLGVFKKIEMIR